MFHPFFDNTVLFQASALADQAPEIESECLHRGGAWIVQLVQVITSGAKLAARGYQIDLHCHFTCTSSRQEKKLNLTRKQTNLRPRC